MKEKSKRIVHQHSQKSLHKQPRSLKVKSIKHTFVRNHNECLGRTFEYIIAKLYNTPDLHKIFKSHLINPQLFDNELERMIQIKKYYPELKYIGNKSHLYDFEIKEEIYFKEEVIKEEVIKEEVIKELVPYLSVKTNFHGSKVCPQRIGQVSIPKFRQHFHLDESYDLEQIKTYIIENTALLLQAYKDHTFHCDLLYYQKKSTYSMMCIIPYTLEKMAQIQFEPEYLSFSHIEKSRIWNESSTLYYTQKGIKYSIGEFQIHRHRKVIKFRWIFQSIFQLFDLQIIYINTSQKRNKDEEDNKDEEIKIE
jgi:hypothetical protein